MKVYLVGGAVRDQLLNLPIKERDWVVVGASPEQLLEKKFRQVGRDFPVFLHPETNEEYALARTERKSAPGYYGFSCDFSTSVTLEEDLARRDLTINAIAQDEQGHIIDPHNGCYDLEHKILRHVSPAFVEDPVRVLRLARFAARYHYLGFRVAAETRSLMYSMVQQSELLHLVAERVWQELQRSLEEKNPEQFFIILRSCDALRVIFPELHALFGIPNPYHYHHEVDSGVHTLMALQGAVAMTEDPVIRFAALVHDLGKAKSPMKNWPSHHGHEEQGVPIIDALCTRLRIPNEYRILATTVSRYHLMIHRLFELRAETIVGVLEKVDAFRRPGLFYNMLLACKADAEGAGRKVDYRQSKLWAYLLAECAKISAQDIMSQGYEGAAIKQALHQRRVACVELILNSWKVNEK
ncbi:MAG: multifunctional CCA addition/repair protein [Legionella sp.]|uniref:multifunctional CCA addition/repair protein n=1 Tax=Legionella sp. TaxID=459 RepID=UPI0039E535A9